LFIEEKDPMAAFMYGLRAPDTRRQYPRRFQYFLNFLSIPGTLEEQAKQFTLKVRETPLWAQESLMSFIGFQKERVKKGELAGSTITNYYKATKLFCVMNDIGLNWKKISRGLPVGRRAANDRAPTIEEVKKLVEYPDRRIKPIIFTMASSGIRIGAWDYLQWKHVKPVSNDEGKIIAAKLIIYSGDSEEYYCFITPEAYTSLKEWMDFRASYGEKITGQSWVMRDLWQTTNMNYSTKLGFATCPKKLKSSGIKRIIERALWEQGLRSSLPNGVKRHEWKAAHGFRKFYKSRAEQVMKPINVELTMGHNIGVSASYYKPTEHEILKDYLKAVDILTISNDNAVLQKEVAELQQKSKDNEYIIRGKLQEKDEEMKSMKQQIDTMQSQIQALIESIGNTKDQNQVNAMAQTLYKSGILDVSSSGNDHTSNQ
jgi:integrase